MLDPSKKARLRWRCRRGMLELDLILIRFADNHLEQLNESQLHSFETLLDCIDPDLYSWLMGYEKPSDKELVDIVEFIKLQTQTR
ncbi:FAD assembly factor SdhE [Legionella jordanis]|nr:succinate dehydrogenase assembly factor 2 [Legionella jordanis]RMX03276.1 succinate dehydrogenase assembly factor 2 family protein [Legionella jordanis]RMX18254.1 succinate dehydrogenase assembly factor 2 family protein [Legionella jordanis]HAT8713277.1 hypothetical protein [Legionella jordanis]